MRTYIQGYKERVKEKTIGKAKFFYYVKNTGPYFAANPCQRITERSEVTLEPLARERAA